MAELKLSAKASIQAEAIKETLKQLGPGLSKNQTWNVGQFSLERARNVVQKI